jgi:hypothetical protein
LEAGQMTEHDRRTYSPHPQEVDSPGQDVQLAPGRRALENSGDDLVRIVTKLTSDVERFDSMVVLQREMLEQRADQVGADELNRQSERISLEAAEMVTSARQALEQLRRLYRVTELSPDEMSRPAR